MGRATQVFRPGEKLNVEHGTRAGFEIQPGNRPEALVNTVDLTEDFF